MKQILLTILISGLFGSFTLAEEIKIALGDWPPYLGKDLKESGVAAHLIKEAFERKGVTVKYKFLPWKRGFDTAAAGKKVHGAAVWLKKPDRVPLFHYSDEVVKEQHVFFHLKKTPFKWDKMSDLFGKKYKVGGLIGFSYGPDMDNAINSKKINMVRVPKAKLNFGKLVKGRIDLYVEELNVGYHILNKEYSKDVVNIGHHSKTVLESPSYLILSKKRKGNDVLLKKFNEGLAELKKDGTFDKYFKDAQEGKYLKK